MFLICSKDNANREQNHQACLYVMPMCSLSSLSVAKIMQIEQMACHKEIGLILKAQKKAIHHGQPIFIVNLKSNTMKNTVQI